MNRESRLLLITDWSSRLWENHRQFWKNLHNVLVINKEKNWKITTCNQLDLETLGFSDRGELEVSYKWTGWVWKITTVVEVQDCWKITNHSRGIYKIYPNLMKENQRTPTCNHQLDLQTLGSQPMSMPKNLPDHCSDFDPIMPKTLPDTTRVSSCVIILSVSLSAKTNVKSKETCGQVCLKVCRVSTQNSKACKPACRLTWNRI